MVFNPAGKMEFERAEWRVARRLQLHRVPDDERGGDLPHGHHDRIVPRRDRPDDPDRFPPEDRRSVPGELPGALRLERSAGPALAAAHDAGLGVLIKEALANGRLTDRGEIRELTRASRDAGTTPDALALAFVLSQPWVDVALSGATTTDQLTSNLGAQDVDPTPLEELVEDPATYWHERGELPWN